jgi:hypothetical protein
MALKGTISGLGIFGNQILRGTISYTAAEQIIKPDNIKIGFYSQQGAYIGSLSTSNDHCGYLSLDLEEKRVGGLESFEFSLAKLPNFTFFNQMVVRIYIKGNHWYTGELDYKSEQETKDVIKKYVGTGYIKYLKDQKIKISYSNKTIKYIIEDLLDTYIVGFTPLEYNSGDINPRNIILTTIEFNNKSLFDIFKDLLEISNENYNNAQYTYGVDNDKFFYFDEISQDTIRLFSEGFQFQEPKIKVNTKDIVNQVDVFRAQSGSQVIEPVSQLNDTTSQEKYGVKNIDLTINNYYEQTLAERIAKAKIEKFKNETIELQIKKLQITNRLDIGFYKIATRRLEYIIQISDFNTFMDWIQSIFYTTVAIDDNEALSGKKSFKVNTQFGSNTEYIEYNLTEPLFFPNEISLYLKQNQVGEYIYIICYDEDGNQIQSAITTPAYLLAEDGSYILQENGGKIELEGGINAFGIEVKFIDTWYRYKLDISSLMNLAKIRILFLTNEVVTFWFDRIEVSANIWKQNKLILDKAKYSMDGTSLTADCTFGESTDTVIDSIKKLTDDNKYLWGVFNKT